MKHVRKLLLITILFLALCLVFFLSGGTETSDLDASARLSVLHGGEVMTLSLAEYLRGVVAAEMPVSFGPEALKAQAVAARTYILASARHENARVCTDSACCLAWCDTDALRAAWGDSFEENLAAVDAAVAATDGEYLVYDSAPIQAVFHASSGGVTEDSGAVWSALPYLQSVSTPETAESVPGLVTTVTVPADVLADALGLDATESPARWLEAIRRNDAGRVKGVLLCGKAFTGSRIRRAFGLRSTDFDLVWDGENFVFTVTGHGHGVGLSQYGAKLLAADGWTYRDILAHYYPGTELVG